MMRIKATLLKLVQSAAHAAAQALQRARRYLTRERALRLGWYATLAALLTILGTASMAYRERRESAAPQPVMAVYTPEPLFMPTPEPTPEPVRFVWPVRGEIIGEYAPDHLVWSGTLGQWQTHVGIDIAAQAGEGVCACAAGTVRDAYTDALWGHVIELEHRDGYVSVYANLNTLNLVEVGEVVEAGQVISAVGSSAACESEMLWHLHFVLMKDGQPVDFEGLMSE